jgi:S-adenosylmethionine:tRNA ribosyltransferase-isomerase
LGERDSSKLLVYRAGEISEDTFRNIGQYFEPGDLLVFNDTKVVHARIVFQKSSGARIEIMCLNPEGATPEAVFRTTDSCRWNVMIGNVKRWKQGELVREIVTGDGVTTLRAELVERKGETGIVQFSWDGGIPFSAVMQAAGVLPLPPYLNREAKDDDEERYQTVYARHEGSVAAPTAGLHFTPAVISGLEARGVTTARLTLHVGAGTFQPVKAYTLGGHNMHSEMFTVQRSVLKQLATAKRVIAVGTTSLRTLESLYWMAAQPGSTQVNQWTPYQEPQPSLTREDAMKALLHRLDANNQTSFTATTGILIAPPYTFRMTDVLVTNFHLPGSTLLLLVAAFVGDDWKKIYGYALEHGFRFLSYGDGSVLVRR